MKHRKRTWFVLALLVAAAVQATDRPGATADSAEVVAQGKADGVAAGWSIHTRQPAGWTQDCCQYAKAIGVDLVLYQGEWTGEPNRVMVLNAWPTKLATLDDEWKDDQKHYLQRDPTAKIEPLPLPGAKTRCRGFVYHGGDHVDDAVVFCDPGKPAGIRFSWSLAIAANDPTRQQLLAQFAQVVEASHCTPQSAATAPHGAPASS